MLLTDGAGDIVYNVPLNDEDLFEIDAQSECVFFVIVVDVNLSLCHTLLSSLQCVGLAG